MMHLVRALVAANVGLAAVAGVTVQSGHRKTPAFGSTSASHDQPSRPTPKLVRWEAVRPLPLYNNIEEQDRVERPLSEFSEEEWREWLYVFALPVFEYATRWGRSVPGVHSGERGWMVPAFFKLLRDRFGRETELELGKESVSGGNRGPGPIIEQMEAEADRLGRSSQELFFPVARRGSQFLHRRTGRMWHLDGESCQERDTQEEQPCAVEGEQEVAASQQGSCAVDPAEAVEGGVDPLLDGSFVRDVGDALAEAEVEREGALDPKMASGELQGQPSDPRGDHQERGPSCRVVTVSVDRASGRYNGTARRRIETGAAALRELLHDETTWITGLGKSPQDHQSAESTRRFLPGMSSCSRRRRERAAPADANENLPKSDCDENPVVAASWRELPWIGDATTSNFLEWLPMPGAGEKPSDAAKFAQERRAFAAGKLPENNAKSVYLGVQTSSSDPGAWARFAQHLQDVLRKPKSCGRELQEKRRVLFRMLVKVSVKQPWFLSCVLNLPDRQVVSGTKSRLLERENTKMLAVMQGVSELLYRLVFPEVRKMLKKKTIISTTSAGGSFAADAAPRLVPVSGEGANPYYGVYVVPSSFYQTDFQKRSSGSAGSTSRSKEPPSLLLLPISLADDTSGGQKVHVSPAIWSPAEPRATAVLSAGRNGPCSGLAHTPSTAETRRFHGVHDFSQQTTTTTREQRRRAQKDDKRFDKKCQSAIKARANNDDASLIPTRSCREAYLGSAGVQNLQLLQTVLSSTAGSSGRPARAAPSVRVVNERALSVHLFCPYHVYLADPSVRLPNDEEQAFQFAADLLGAPGGHLASDRNGPTESQIGLTRMPWWPEFVHAWRRAREAEGAEWRASGAEAGVLDVGRTAGVSIAFDRRGLPRLVRDSLHSRDLHVAGERAKCIALGVVRPGLKAGDPQRSFSMGAGDLAQARVLGHEHEM
eukprot:g20280.t1